MNFRLLLVHRCGGGLLLHDGIYHRTSLRSILGICLRVNHRKCGLTDSHDVQNAGHRHYRNTWRPQSADGAVYVVPRRFTHRLHLHSASLHEQSFGHFLDWGSDRVVVCLVHFVRVGRVTDLVPGLASFVVRRSFVEREWIFGHLQRNLLDAVKSTSNVKYLIKLVLRHLYSNYFKTLQYLANFIQTNSIKPAIHVHVSMLLPR